MKSSDPEYPRLFEIFREECGEHIQKLNDGLLLIERQPSEAPWNEIMRTAHSLKGASRMMGIKTIETLSHRLETLLTQLNSGKQQISSTVMDALYRGVDSVSQSIAALAEGGEPESIAEVVEQIEAAAREKSPPEAPQVSESPDAKDKTSPAQGSSPTSIQKKHGIALSTIRVQTNRLDTLINQAGELLVSKIEALENLRHIEKTLDLLEEWRHTFARDNEQSPSLIRLDALNEELYNVLLGLSESTHRLERLVDDIHEGVRDLRLLPLSTILEPLSRTVRDLCRELGKEVELNLQGTATHLDKKILEELRDPLIHLVRNSIDHGIEPPEEREKKGKQRQGKILIAARQEGGRVWISVSDDGRGLNRQEIERAAIQKGIASADEIGRWQDNKVWELIFHPGFSTALSVTEISGRGVGMDLVLNRIQGLKGSLTIESKVGEGITLNLSLPLTLSTTHALLFKVGGELFCLPTDSLDKTLLLLPSQISTVEGKETAIIDGELLAFAWLADILNLPKEKTENVTIPALLLETQIGRMVLGVEALLGEEEIVAKGLGNLLGQVQNLSGGTILGRGQIALILNPNDLVGSHANQGQIRPFVSSSPISPAPVQPLTRKKVLIAEDSLITRTLEKDILEAAGFDVTTAVDGEDALAKLNEKSFDIVISDVQMPSLDGIGLTERIKNSDRFKNIPVILVTSLQTEADKRRGIEVGADAYLTKSTFDEKHFLGIIQQFA